MQICEHVLVSSKPLCRESGTFKVKGMTTRKLRHLGTLHYYISERFPVCQPVSRKSFAGDHNYNGNVAKGGNGRRKNDKGMRLVMIFLMIHFNTYIYNCIYVNKDALPRHVNTVNTPNVRRQIRTQPCSLQAPTSKPGIRLPNFQLWHAASGTSSCSFQHSCKHMETHHNNPRISMQIDRFQAGTLTNKK